MSNNWCEQMQQVNKEVISNFLYKIINIPKGTFDNSMLI